MRVAPRLWMGIVAVVTYAVIVVAIQGTSGIPYTELGASASNLWRSGVLSIGVASVVMAALARWWGWWRPALVDQPPNPRKWLLVAPALLLVLGVSNLVLTDWSKLSAGFVVAGLALGVAVGFGEEIATRGLLLVGVRARFREVGVWIVTCVLFGFLHGLNIVLGAPVLNTGIQIVNAGLSGSIFYIARRVTGSLVWAMTLHGFWDFSLFIIGASGAANPLSFGSLAAGVIATVLGFWATKDAPGSTRGRAETSATPQPAPSTS